MATAKIAPMNETTMSNALVANNLPILSLQGGALGSLEAYIGGVHQIPVLAADIGFQRTQRTTLKRQDRQVVGNKGIGHRGLVHGGDFSSRHL
jgi:hypothetical protein